ncbi:MAG: hypothetical protein IKH30_08875 [Clostridia bacterium]|nr:hypothetical protein [Clostridia bacterium]
MCVPEQHRDSIRDFIDRYFIEDAMPDAPVVDETVRVIYYETEGVKLGSPHVTKKYLAFDIYVKSNALYNADADRLKRRDKMIAQRLKE